MSGVISVDADGTLHLAVCTCQLRRWSEKALGPELRRALEPYLPKRDTDLEQHMLYEEEWIFPRVNDRMAVAELIDDHTHFRSVTDWTDEEIARLQRHIDLENKLIMDDPMTRRVLP